MAAVLGHAANRADDDTAAYRAAYQTEQRAEADLVRCLVGNPFHPVVLAPDVLTWNGGLVVRLAQTACDERQLPSGMLDSGRLGILASALEEAGCSDVEMLRHLRGPGPHWRGCFVIDALLPATRNNGGKCP